MIETLKGACYNETEVMRMTTGERIKAARKKKGLSQVQLGEMLGIPFQSISQWERDARNPKKETLRKIAQALDVSVADLDGEEEAYVQLLLQTVDGREVVVNMPRVYIMGQPEHKPEDKR